MRKMARAESKEGIEADVSAAAGSGATDSEAVDSKCGGSGFIEAGLSAGELIRSVQLRW
jgi:hypothetical protein